MSGPGARVADGGLVELYGRFRAMLTRTAPHDRAEAVRDVVAHPICQLKLRSACARVTRSAASARDLRADALQTAVCEVIQRLQSPRLRYVDEGPSRFGGWLYRLCLNAFRSSWRMIRAEETRWRSFGRPARIADVAPLTQCSTTRHDRLIAVLDAIHSMEDRDLADPLGQRTTTVYDAAGQRTATVNPLEHRTSFGYDLASRQVRTTNARGYSTTSVFDAAGRTIATIDPLNRRTSFTYDALNRQITVRNPLNEITTTVYDREGQVLATVDPLGRRTSYSYNAVGWRFEEINPLSQTTTTLYDLTGREVAVINPLGHRTSMAYDADGRRIRVRDAEQHVTTTIYDLAGRVRATVDALGNRVTNIYNVMGWRIALVDANDHRTSFSYDLAGRQLTVEDPLSNVVSNSYDATGRRVLRIDARGNRTSYTFDEDDRETRRRYPDGTRVTQTWDPVGNRTRLHDATGRYTATYDPADRKVLVVNPVTKRITYAWDDADRRDYLADPDGGRFTYTHDAAGQLTTLVNPEGDSTAFDYDDAGREISRVLANGTRTSFTYDDAGRVTRIVHLKSDATTISSFHYEYDKADHRTSVLEAGGDRVTWTYDDTYQLLVERRSGANAYSTTFSYDPAGNRLTKGDGSGVTTYAYDDANRLRYSQDGSGRTTYTFDADGNRQLVEASSGDLTTYTWDFENQNTQVELPAGDVVTFTFNGDLKRVSRDDDVDVVKFVWDEQNILVETDGADLTQVVYTLRAAEYGDLVSQRRGSDSLYHHFDALGSTDALTDSSEVVSDTYTYKAFGEITASTGTTENPFQWVGEVGYYAAPELDLHHVRRRDYEAGNGHFASRDPMWFEDGESHLYRYAGNDPISKRDPSGLQGAELTSSELKGQIRFDPKSIPSSRIESMVAQGLARYSKQGTSEEDPTFVFFGDIIGNQRVIMVLEKYRRSLPLDTGGEIPYGHPVYRIAAYSAVELYDYVDVDYVFTRIRSQEVADRNIDALLHDRDEREFAAAMNAIVITYQMLPFGNAALAAGDGDYAEMAISLAGDFALFTGFGAFAKGVQGTRRAAQLRVVATATEGSVAGVRGVQGFVALGEGDIPEALGYFGEATMGLLGLSAQQVMALRAGRKAPADTASQGAVREALSDEAERSLTEATERALSRRTDDAINAVRRGAAHDIRPSRPTWRQSEIDVGTALKGEGYREQVSFKGGQEVPYGTRGSVRPEYYKEGSSVEVKNYDVETSGGRRKLVRNVTSQARQRAVELPKGTRQEVRIDVRGQTISRETLRDLPTTIAENSGGALKPEDITFIR